MRMTFSTPVTPTRERLTWVEGRRAWTSLPRTVRGSFIRLWTIPRQNTEANRTSRCTMARVGCLPWTSAPNGQPLAVFTAAQNPVVLTALTGPAVVEGARVTEKHEAAVGLLEEPAEARFMDVEELRGLATEGRERGFLTFEEIATCLEEVEVTKEQISDFRAHLVEAGVDIVSNDGRPHSGGLNDSPAGAEGPVAPKKPEIDLTVEPSLDSLRLYLRSIG